MSYQVEMISELDGLSLASTAENIPKYISTKNCTALLIGVQCLENGAAIPTAANIHAKMGTIEIVVSNKDGGGTQFSMDFDDIPPLMEKIYGKPLPGVQGLTANNDFCHFQYWLPLSPDPWSSKFGYRDAIVRFLTAADGSEADTYKLYVAALLHDESPQYYIQTLNNPFTATSGVYKDLDIPEGAAIMGTYAMGTTSLFALTSSDAPTIDELALYVGNTERNRINTRCIHAYTPTGFYIVPNTTLAASTVTSTDNATAASAMGGSKYVFWDLGYRRQSGIPIGNAWKLRIKPAASDAVRVYPLIAMRARGG